MTLTDPRAGVPAAAHDLVVLLDDDGTPVGEADRLTVHDSATPLHLAFSLHLLDSRGRTLVTRRALAKKTWPGVWTNSCCGHPRPGEDVTAAVVRRAGEELGLTVTGVQVALPSFRYRAVDAGGVVENELCPVHVARLDESAVPDPDPAEVAEIAWVPWPDLYEAVRRTPFAFSPWLVLQAQAVGPDIMRYLTTAAEETC
ncbi:isopentenyl-diphosphate Delta-isomerase [Kineosporia sp. NBRC 101731]|uniref:isopentenyl-diphosphate Delta-isomerase n=1 Tax=Kineosporia sp. NBRC 101731 TaxID=3032199 RepID=UPI0024A0EE2C|nr:isopentenyl-diphosphate Delta-isomerase [Kineosporia sp. NBRC 101731]GLY31002.1 isopentenyl-diphosphate Delta-isomerase [Kineosporia sp. NBRC 101731]